MLPSSSSQLPRGSLLPPTACLRCVFPRLPFMSTAFFFCCVALCCLVPGLLCALFHCFKPLNGFFLCGPGLDARWKGVWRRDWRLEAIHGCSFLVASFTKTCNSSNLVSLGFYRKSAAAFAAAAPAAAPASLSPLPLLYFSGLAFSSVPRPWTPRGRFGGTQNPASRILSRISIH